MRNANVDVIIEHLSKMQAELYRLNGRKAITRISIDSDVAIGMGIAPGTCAIVYTSVGAVEVYAERRPDIEWRRAYLGEWVPHE